MNQVIDFSTLTWVKNELDNTLKEARQALEAHVENPQDEAQLGFLAAHLHQVYGTLQMVELYGASLLAEEMEQVAKAIADETVSQRDEACEVLMRATLQLPDYLERLISGYRDIPLVLLPLLNDLRAVRGQPLLSENSMFSPDLQAALPDTIDYGKADGDQQKTFRDLRHRFQLGLLGWFRGRNAPQALGGLGEVLQGLQAASSQAGTARLWWVAAGIVDALRGEALDSSIAVKRLLGQVDREIKRLIDQGEDALGREFDADLYKNLLFYAAQSPAGCSRRLDDIQATYRLKELLPDESELAAARESMTGHNADLFETVAVAVKEELARLKDTLDIVLRNGCKESEELVPLIASLNSLGDTLGMLSLGAARTAVVAKATDLQAFVDTAETPVDTALMDVASTLLFVESSVEGMGSGRAVSEDAKVEDQLAQNEYNQVMDVVLQEAITDLRRAKEAVIAYIDSDHDTAELGEVPQWFNQVKGGLLLLSEARAAALVEAINRYIAKELIDNRKQASQQELDSLADSVCGLEYYLESRKEHRMYGSAAMTVAEQGVDRLGYPADGLDDTAAPSAGAAETFTEAAAAGPVSDDAGPTVPGAADAGETVAELDTAEPATDADAFDFDFSLLDDAGNGGDTAANEDAAVAAAAPDELPAAAGADTESGLEPEAMETAVAPDPVAEAPVVANAEAGNLEEVAAVAEAAPAATAATPAPEDMDDGLEVIGEDVDDEILEIFIEEAEEELQSITEQLPAWLANTDDAEALGTMRRSYHTLKGSGRLVGAMRIGEFAWAFENMLNRLIDGTVSASPAMTDLLKSALEALPELVAQIKEGTPTAQPIAYLKKCADALSAGEALPEPAGGSVAAPDAAAAAEEAAAEEVEVESVAEAADEEAEEVFIEPALDLENVVLPIDEVDESGAVPEGSVSATFDANADEGVMDPMLYEIFNAETQAHLEVVRQFLNQAAGGDLQVSEPLARAMHTLHGSAHMAEAEEIAELAGVFERYLKALMDAAMPVEDAGCQLLQDTISIVESMLESLPETDHLPDNYAQVLQQVRDLHAAVPAVQSDEAGIAEMTDHHADDPQAVAETPADDSAEEAGFDAPPAADEAEVAVQEWTQQSDSEAGADYYADHDEELLEIFLEESAENLEAGDSALHRWRDSADDADALAELQRALHTLKGGARMADLPEIGDVAHAVESLVIAIADGACSASSEAMDGVQQAQDAMSDLLDNVRHRQPMHAASELVTRLESLRAAGVQSKPAADAADSQQEALAADAAPAEKAAADTRSDPYADADPELLEVFLEEAGDILENSEQTLQNWKHAPDDQALVAELQRELHTLKGGARMADITEIGDLAHAVESLMVKINEGERSTSESMFAVLEQAHDKLAAMVDQVRRHQPLAEAREVVANLEKLREGKEVQAAAPAKKAKPKKTAVAVAVEEEAEHVERRARSRNTQELVRVKANLLDNMVNYAGEVSIYRSRLEQQVGAYRFNLVEMEQTVSRLREQLRRLEIETEAQVLFRYEKETEAANADAAVDGGEAGEDFDPLEMDRYSHMQQLSRSLLESVGDLSSIQSLLENITRESETLLLQQSRVNTELQEGLMRTRMVPFLGLAARMRRIVRQTTQELGKKAELELSGAEGEMDRTVVDRIIAPIEHMLRNAIAHGIESPEVRVKAGKAEMGTIKITLERESSDVVLKIADDGAGISLEAVRKKAVERGLMQADADLTDTEILQFILETGFSTAGKVTQVAGRGVGMDVVNSEVKQLGGALHIDSEYGNGTTFTIRLPFTLALNQALLIEVGEDTYAIPLSSIEGIVRMRREDLKAHYDDPESRFEYGGFAYEVAHLGSTLGTGKPHLDSGGPKRLPVMLARVGDHCVAFHVENLLGSREIVVKSVGPQISTVRGVSGATILGDGRVVMILDIAALLRGGASALDQVSEMIQQPVRTAGLTVMVVDDSITVRKVTTRVLERNDMHVIAAKDGVDAVSKLQENIPDIMLLDIEMPRMDGFELATHVRNEARLRDIPIIMITSRTGDKHRQRAMQIGVNRYLGKPFQESDLLENIRALLEEKSLDG